MNKVKNLFSLSYYSGILEGNNKFRWLLAIIFLSIIISIQPAIFIFTKAYPFVKDLEKKVVNLVDEVYPNELEINIKNGIVKTNVTEPFYIVVRQETLDNILGIKEDNNNTISKVRLIAIDTKGRAEDFEQYQSYALLTERSVVYYNDGNVNIYSLREIEDLTINKEIVLNVITEFNNEHNISNLLNIFVLISPVLILFGLFIFQLYILLFTSIAVYIMVRIKKVHSGFWNTFRYTVAISFIPVLIWNLVSFIPFAENILPFIGSVLFVLILGLGYLGIAKLEANKVNLTENNPSIPNAIQPPASNQTINTYTSNTNQANNYEKS